MENYLKPAEKYYAVTLKFVKTNRKPKVSDYTSWILNAQLLQDDLKLIVEGYELDSKQRIHYHAVISSKRNLFKKKFVVAGIHQQIDYLPLIKDFLNYSRYCKKSCMGPINIQKFE